MAKGQKRNGREPKKPKATKQKPAAGATVAAIMPSKKSGR